MKKKTRQISPKNFCLLLGYLSLFFGKVMCLPLSEKNRGHFVHLYRQIMGIIVGTDTLADHRNSDKPSGKTLGPAKKPEKKSNGKQG